MEILDLMNEIGMKKAVKNIEGNLELDRKLRIAYQNFEFVTKEAIEEFNTNLKKKTICFFDHKTKEKIEKINPQKYNDVVYDSLVLGNLADYGKTPPLESLRKIKEANDLGCFDSFEVGEIKSVVEVIDPIVFGLVKGCSDRFFITQWDDDVKFEDIKQYGKHFNDAINHNDNASKLG